MFFFWPVLITQIWGIIKQSKLDDKALELSMEVINMNSFNKGLNDNETNAKFCTNCGTRNPWSAKFCSECGKPF